MFLLGIDILCYVFAVRDNLPRFNSLSFSVNFILSASKYSLSFSVNFILSASKYKTSLVSLELAQTVTLT